MKSISICLTLAFIITFPTDLLAQGPGFDGGVNDGGPSVPGVPLDGGLSLLLAAGLGYSVKKYRDLNRKKVNDSPDGV